MDNKVSETQLAWLAGIVDGEGSIGMYPNPCHQGKRGNKNGNIVYIKHVEVANNDTVIIVGVQEIVSNIIGRTIKIVESKTKSIKRIHKLYRIEITRQSDIIKVLTVIEPYLLGKKAQAQALLCVMRSHIYNTKYTKLELQVIDILKRMKTEHMQPMHGNAEPSRSEQSLQACVETLQAQLL